MAYIKAVLKAFRFAFKTITSTVITLLFVASLMMNIIMMTWTTGAIAIGTAFTALTGVTSVVTGLKDANDKLKVNKEAAGKITKKIAKRTKRGALRNVAAIPAESIPIAGIAVVVAVTALELKDACDTMKDMNELNQLMGNGDPIAEDKDMVCGIEVPTA